MPKEPKKVRRIKCSFLKSFDKKRATWNYIKNKLQLTIGILAFLSLLADSIQIIEFLNQHIETMKDLIKMAAFAVGTTMVTYPLCSTELATCAGRMPSLD